MQAILNVDIKEKVKSIITAITITISIALVYFYLCEITPTLSHSPILLPLFGKTFRIANVLHALVIVSPLCPLGVAIGATAFNMISGTLSLTAPILYLSGYCLNKHYSTIENPSTIIDLYYISLYGLLVGFFVSMNHVTVLYLSGHFNVGLFWIVVIKIISTITICVMGYPLVLFFRKYIK